MMTASERHAYITDAIRSVIPNAVHGVFTLNEAHLDRAPSQARGVLADIVGWSIIAYGVPITDDGLWVWHQHGEYRSLLANYVLARAREAVHRAAGAVGDRIVSLTELTDNAVSMVEVGELAGIGTRGWNNLLLHPTYGSWMQLEAIATPGEASPDGVVSFPVDVCTKCMNCIADCPADALRHVGDFNAPACAKLVAAPWNPRSRAVALTSRSYIECRECIVSCPIGEQPEGILEWQR